MKSICEDCVGELNAYNRILMGNTGKLPSHKTSFKEGMRRLCIDCAAKECHMWQAQQKGYGDQRTDHWRKECEKAVFRSENVNNYTIERQLGKKSSAMMGAGAGGGGRGKGGAGSGTSSSRRNRRLRRFNANRRVWRDRQGAGAAGGAGVGDCQVIKKMKHEKFRDWKTRCRNNVEPPCYFDNKNKICREKNPKICKGYNRERCDEDQLCEWDDSPGGGGCTTRAEAKSVWEYAHWKLALPHIREYSDLVADCKDFILSLTKEQVLLMPWNKMNDDFNPPGWQLFLGRTQVGPDGIPRGPYEGLPPDHGTYYPFESKKEKCQDCTFFEGGEIICNACFDRNLAKEEAAARGETDWRPVTITRMRRRSEEELEKVAEYYDDDPLLGVRVQAETFDVEVQDENGHLALWTKMQLMTPRIRGNEDDGDWLDDEPPGSIRSVGFGKDATLDWVTFQLAVKGIADRKFYLARMGMLGEETPPLERPNWDRLEVIQSPSICQVLRKYESEELEKGDKVTAKLKGWTEYFPGRIASVNSEDDTYDITFFYTTHGKVTSEDGEKRRDVPRSQIKSVSEYNSCIEYYHKCQWMDYLNRLFREGVFSQLLSDDGGLGEHFSGREPVFRLEAFTKHFGYHKPWIMSVVKQNGADLEYASPELRNDREVVLAAVQEDGRALRWASAELRNDREVVLAAVQEDGRALRWASAELREDKEMILGGEEEKV